MRSIVISRFAIAVLMSVSLLANAQTVITSGVQTYATLSSTTVIMSNRCELRVTSATTPLSGCTINLNSVDAWLFLTGVKPSVVASTYLAQIKIANGAAVADSNCRVVQYGQNGAVVIPQSSSFQPLTVFTGAEFTGTATSYSQWNYYTGTAYTNISSFKLKRGYQAVLAQSANGANYSKCYVAQDGDLEIGVLPAMLDKQVQFIYVTPWRWTSKKGWGQTGTSIGAGQYLSVLWNYSWAINQNSSRDLEYVPIRQVRWDPSLSQSWQTIGANTVLGYNEPDNTAQANIAVGDANWSWPDLLGTGLRVGSPACTDGGVSSWLLPFMTDIATSQANEDNAPGLRVDFVAQHYYQSHNPADPSGCASQMYNFLLNIWNNTHRPIWVTEWNNGANWTDGTWPAPTYSQQQACIAAMTQMLESTPFVERYALYNWVEDQRSLVTSSNTVTAAGTTYSNLVSSIGYSQAMPDNGTRGIAEFLFLTNAWDSSGYDNNGMAVGSPAYTTGHSSQSQAIALDGTNSYVQLPANIAAGSAFTFAAWIYWNGGGNWQRIFDFGSVSTTQGGDPNQYMFLTPSSGSSLRFAIKNGGSEQIVEHSGALASGSWQHVAVTLNGSTAILYLNGAPVATNSSLTIAPSAFAPIKNYLGKSNFPNDPLFNGKLDEVEIADYALSAAQISARYSSAQFPAYTGGIWTTNASGNWGTNNNWSGGAVASGASYLADFSTIDITANRTVTLDSARTVGGLKCGDLAGAQTWTLAGTNTLTLDAGGGVTPAIAVNQNTATISTPLSGSYGFTKTGGGTLTLNGTNALGGGLTVSNGTVNISGGISAFGSGTSTVGYLTGSGNLALSAGTLAIAGELQVGGSDRSGSQYVATGAVTVANATLSVGSLAVARGSYLDNTMSGTVTVNSGGTVISTNDVIVEFAGAGRGALALNGGNFIIGPTATKWLMVGFYDSGAGELDVTNGTLFLENGTSLKLCRNGNTGGNVVNQIGGNVTFYSDAGVTVGGGGNLDLNYAGGATSTNTYNLNGGTLTVPQVVVTSGAGNGTFNFNGGTLKSAATSTTFMQGLTRANVRNSGAKIDTAGASVTIGQALLHSAIGGDFSTDGGMVKNGAGMLTLAGTNTYNGVTTVNAGTLLVNGSIGSGAVTVAGGTLGGNGAIGGTVTVLSGGTLAPGGGLAALTVNGGVTLQPGSTTFLEISKSSLTNDQLVAGGALNYGGTLVVTNLGGTLVVGDSFKLFRAGSFNGAFASNSLPSLPAGFGWNTAALGGGIIKVIPATPTNLVWSVSGTNLNFSWPQSYTGWRLLMQTNHLANGISSNTNDWATVANSSQTNQIAWPIYPSQPAEFYRLIFP